MENYYEKKIMLAQVNREDAIIGEIERWEAHKKGILHRGFTAILTYQNQYLLQHRKHIVFDKTWDFTFSSHQIYTGGNLQSDVDAIYTALTREWNVTKDDLEHEPVKLGTIYYQAKDAGSIYMEHEMDYIYLAQLKRLPQQDSDFAYGYEIVPSIEEIKKLSGSYVFAPWVEVILKEIPLTKTL